MSEFEVFETFAGGRIKAWVKGVTVEDVANSVNRPSSEESLEEYMDGSSE